MDYNKRVPKADIPELKWIEGVTRVMDNAFSIPGTKFRFGLDSIIGLIPGAGEFVTFGISGILVLAMSRHGASGKVIVKMLLNVLVDTLIGAIPIIGDLFDFGFKANQRNLKLLKEHYHEGKHQGSGAGVIVGVLIGLLAILVLLIWGIAELLSWMWSAIF